MEIHENDKGYTTMVFKLTSPTLQKTLKICVGKPYDEGGLEVYNVYQVSEDGNTIVKLAGKYKVEKGTVVMDDGDFPVMKMGEPMWENMDAKALPEKKEAPVSVSKSDFIVIDNDSSGDCFYDAVIRAETNSADVYSGEKIGELRRKIGEFISKTPKFRETLLGKYDSYKTTKLKRMNQMDGYKEYYQRVQDDGEDEDSVYTELKEKFPSLNEALIQNKFADDFYPDPTQEEIIHLLTEYFDKRTDLVGDQVIDTFVRNLQQPKKWVVEDVIAAYQEMNNVQVVPLVKKGTRVEDYMVHPTVLKKEQLLPSTKYIFAQYTPLTHFQLIVRSSDKKGGFVQSELPATLQRKVSESPILSRAKSPEVSPLYIPEKPAEQAEKPLVTMAEKPPGMVLDSGEPEPVKKDKEKKAVPVSELDTIKLVKPTDDGTRKLEGVPAISQEELDVISKMKKFEAYEHATKTIPWGQYFIGKGYETYTASTLNNKQEISTVEKLVAALKAHPNEPTMFYKAKKSSTEKKKKP
jgi:hypothetical protein